MAVKIMFSIRTQQEHNHKKHSSLFKVILRDVGNIERNRERSPVGYLPKLKPKKRRAESGDFNNLLHSNNQMMWIKSPNLVKNIENTERATRSANSKIPNNQNDYYPAKLKLNLGLMSKRKNLDYEQPMIIEGLRPVPLTLRGISNSSEANNENEAPFLNFQGISKLQDKDYESKYNFVIEDLYHIEKNIKDSEVLSSIDTESPLPSYMPKYFAKLYKS
ncbi:unnamed protein product [Blepharisma stoltei]|uniref:Uncharacterized protein n=1 Tax=Blepharisma stoltei TaxID=1481888 RepID=A0AAU9JSP3_9CILI|nr:unnamed protein product [Blepharisma stoltei]